MPDITLPLETVDSALAPFYQAIGKAVVRWQHVEASLYILTHALLDADSKASSVVFFHIQSADSKIQLADRLCRASMTGTAIEEWRDLLKKLNDAIPFRNALAHWEASFIIDPRLLEPGEPPMALTRHHLDIRSAEDTRAITTSTANKVADEYLTLADGILRFVVRHFPLERLRATHLQPRLLQYLENIQNALRSPQQPPLPSPS